MAAIGTERGTKAAIPKWEADARESIKTAIHRLSKPLSELVARDANEGDTRLVVTQFLCDGLGFDMFRDLSTEVGVRSEWADYGVRIDKQLVAFIEVKRAAQKLSVKNLHQVETYAMSEGLEWVVLTNGQTWQAYHVLAQTGQQVATNLVLEVDLLSDEPIAHKVDRLFYLHRAAFKRELMGQLWQRASATSESALAAVLITQPVLEAVRKEVHRASGYLPDLKQLERAIQGLRPDLYI
jgi:predicted type IV restriction endonuclease